MLRAVTQVPDVGGGGGAWCARVWPAWMEIGKDCGGGEMTTQAPHPQPILWPGPRSGATMGIPGGEYASWGLPLREAHIVSRTNTVFYCPCSGVLLVFFCFKKKFFF